MLSLAQINYPFYQF